MILIEYGQNLQTQGLLSMFLKAEYSKINLRSHWSCVHLQWHSQKSLFILTWEELGKKKQTSLRNQYFVSFPSWLTIAPDIFTILLMGWHGWRPRAALEVSFIIKTLCQRIPLTDTLGWKHHNKTSEVQPLILCICMIKSLNEFAFLLLTLQY